MLSPVHLGRASLHLLLWHCCSSADPCCAIESDHSRTRAQVLDVAARGGKWKPDLLLIHSSLTPWMLEMALALPNALFYLVRVSALVVLCGRRRFVSTKPPRSFNELSKGERVGMASCCYNACFVVLLFRLLSL
jgi:hypothetical protein